MVRVLLVTTNYWPEPTGIAVYTTDLAESLHGSGLDVSVLTSLPHYPWWKVPSEFAHLTEGVTHHESVQVIRANHLIPLKINAFVRMRFESSLWWNLRRVSKSLVGNGFDAVVACIPTVAAGVVGKTIARRLSIPFGLIVQDLSGAGAKQSGLRGGTLMSKVAQAVEGSVLKEADSMVVVSPAMRDVVTSIGVPASKVLEITNYSARNIEVVSQELARKSFGWSSDEFMVIHTGNMGAKQGLENVIEAAKVFGSDAKIKIYLVGHGNQEANLKKSSEGLKNLVIMDAVEDDQYSALLSAADLLLVNERSTQMEMSLPSKLASYLYSEHPVLAAVPKGGATWKFLEGISELVEAGKPTLLARAIEDLSRDPEKRKHLASKGLEFARRNLDAEIGRRKYLDWVNSLIESKRG
jgi:glycosyltransferase involved in cell wall biosynthesis